MCCSLHGNFTKNLRINKFVLNKKLPLWEGVRMPWTNSLSPPSVSRSPLPFDSSLTGALSLLSPFQWGLFATFLYISWCIKLNVQMIVKQIFILNETFNCWGQESILLSLFTPDSPPPTYRLLMLCCNIVNYGCSIQIPDIQTVMFNRWSEPVALLLFDRPVLMFLPGTLKSLKEPRGEPSGLQYCAIKSERVFKQPEKRDFIIYWCTNTPRLYSSHSRIASKMT